MAGILTNSQVGSFDANVIDGGAGTVIKMALGDDPEAQRQLAGTNTFQVRAFTDSAEVLNCLNLTTLGVTFPVNTVRTIRTKAWARNKAGTKVAYSESFVVVIGNGATAPALSVATVATSSDKFLDTRYLVRTPLVGSASATVETFSAAAKFLKAEPVITATTNVAIQIGGGLTSVDLNWLVECEVGALKILPTPIATAGS